MVLGRPAGAAGQEPLSQRSRQLFRIHLSAAAGGAAGDPELVRQDPALSLPVVPQRRRVVDDGAVLARDDGIGAQARPVAGGAAGLRHRYLRVRHVRSRPAQPRAAGADAVRLLAVAGSARLDGGQHVRARHRHQGVPGRGASLSGLAPAMGGGREHAGLSGRVPVRAAGAVPRLPAQRRGAEDLVPGHGRLEFGEGVRPARRAELVLGQSVDHRGDAPPDAAGELQSGRSGQAGAHHEYRQSRFQDGELDRAGDLACDRDRLSRGDAAGLAPDRTVGRRGARHPVLPDDGGLAAGAAILFHVAVLPDDRADASRRL